MTGRTTSISVSFVSSGQQETASYSDYSTASAAAQTASASYDGGDWSILGVVGYDWQTEVAIPSAVLAEPTGSGCTAGRIGEEPSSVDVPAMPSGAQVGDATMWLVYMGQGSDVTLLVLVEATSATLLLTETGGSSCGYDRDRTTARALSDY